MSLKKEDLKAQVMENIRIVINNARNHKGNEEKEVYMPTFLRKYEADHKVATVVTYCVEFLERDRQYDVACLLLTKLLMNVQVKPEKRGAWWVRLCIDLKHLKFKKESLKVAEHALLEQSWVKTGYKNSLFRIKDELTKFLSNQ